MDKYDKQENLMHWINGLDSESIDILCNEYIDIPKGIIHSISEKKELLISWINDMDECALDSIIEEYL
jgi:hypothetical protein